MKIKYLDRYKKSSIRTYNKWENYDKCFCFKIFKTEDWIKGISSEIDHIEDSVILDVGCGTGRILEPLISYKPKKLCGMDISEGILEIASKKPKIKDSNVELKIGDAETEIPWGDSYFDYVLVPGVFHHLFRPLDALKEIRRVLKLNGKIIIVDPLFPYILRILMNFFLLITPVNGDYRFYSLRGIEKKLLKAGFKNVSCRRIPIISMVAAGQKKR